ncbi:MAG TPA: tetratricopeptide repeat protein, partial [Pirellulales bacterium]|nr:tetratricopeptide repeat protein [Pirellulales bacterium]
VLFALGLLAKPMVVTLPPLLLLLDFWPLARLGSPIDAPRWTASVERPGVWQLLLEKLPLVALAAGDCLVTLRTHASGGEHLAWSVRLGNAAVSCVTYVVQFFYPVDLAAFYPMTPGGPPIWKVAGSIAILSAACIAAVIWRRRCPYCFVGWFWYLGLLAPVLGVVTIGWLAMADRYMYLPSIGLSIAVAWSGARWAAGSTARQWIVGASAGVAIALLIKCATVQTSYWSDDETLWRHTLACTSANSKAELALAKELGRQDRIDEAIVYCRRAEQNATDAAPFNDLGVLLSEQGKLDEAITLFREGLAVEPGSSLGHFNLGTALASQDLFDESAEHFRRAIELDPHNVNASIGLAHLLLSRGRTDDARIELERALAVDPDNSAIRNDLGSVLLQQGRIDESIQQYQAALAIDPNLALTYINLGSALAARGQVEQALAHFRRAIELEPSNALARSKLDKLLRRTGPPASGS